MIEETAYAKLTLSLHVGAKRASGLHELDAEVVEVSLCDQIQISPTGETSLVVTPDFPALANVRADAFHMPAVEENLAVRAAHLIGESARLSITKRIPTQAGLGGGSSDAAAVVRGLGFEGDHQRLLELGSDVPYSLCGGHARVGGVGEEFLPLVEVSGTVTLFLMPFGLSTGDVYRAYDEVGAASGPNSLVKAARALEPRLEELESEISAKTGYSPLLAGSGSTLFTVASLADLRIEQQGVMGSCPFATLTLDAGTVNAVEVEIVNRTSKKA